MLFGVSHRRLVGFIAALFFFAPLTAAAQKDNKDGFVAADWFNTRQVAYLTFVTSKKRADNVMNAIAAMEMHRRNSEFPIEENSITLASWAKIFDKVAQLRDTSDFDILNLLNTVYGYDKDPMLAADVWKKIDATLIGFKYWYTQPSPENVTDQMWYWSENHQLLFHTNELLAGQRFPETKFTATGMLGKEHVEHATKMLLRWLDLHARFGFFEWHSQVYYALDVAALLSLVEFAHNAEIVQRATMVLDLLLFDLATHNFNGSFSASQGRTYKKDKMNAAAQDVYNTVKLLFDTTKGDFTGSGDAAAVLLARAKRYQLPLVIFQAAHADFSAINRERMGVPFDEHEPIVAGTAPTAPLGLSYSNEDDLVVWWGMSALSTWQTMPLSLSVIEKNNLWATGAFSKFDVMPLRMLLKRDLNYLQQFARDNAHVAAMALLRQVDSYTLRTPDFMLATAQDYRKGSRANQLHAWQATLGNNAIVFTTHPATPPADTVEWAVDDDPGYWTGSASLPRGIQHQNVGIYLYAPQYRPIGLFGALTGYEPYTHAYFPQDAFDEVVREGNWTFGRKKDAYVALYSWRKPTWVTYDPKTTATNGMKKPFDLRADGGAENVWIVECSSRAQSGDFENFRKAIAAATVKIATEKTKISDAEADKFSSVSYVSPSVGKLEVGWDAPLRIDDKETAIGGYARFDNPWVKASFGSQQFVIVDPRNGTGLNLDFAASKRLTNPPK